LDAAPASKIQENVACLIAGMLYGVPWSDVALIDRVLATAGTNPILLAALKAVLDPVELGSQEAKDQKESYERRRRRKDPTPVPEAVPNPEDVIGVIDSSNVRAFVDVCFRLGGTSWYPDEEVLPGWESVRPPIQMQVVRAAERYLNDYCVVSTAWIDTGEVWYNVTCGYWALRLLTQVAPDILQGLSSDVWYAWMPSVFGDSYMRQDPDPVQVTILKTAYRRAPARFRKLLGRLIDGQNQRAGDVLILDRVAAVWDHDIADLLRSKLVDPRLAPRAFRSVLAVLIQAGDEEAKRIATDQVNAARDVAPAELAKPIEAALELLVSHPSAGWRAVWPVAKVNYEFAERLVGCLALDPYSSATTRVLEGVSEDALADLQIWLFQHHPTQEGGGVPS